MEFFIYRENPKTIRNFRWCWQRGVINADSFWPVWCYCWGKLGTGNVALRCRAIWNGRLHSLQLAPGVKIFRSWGFLQHQGFCGTKSLIIHGMPAGDCCWQCFLQHLTWAVLNSSSCTFFINYICELFIDFPPSTHSFFFFLLTAADVFVINYLVGIAWHEREYFTNDYIFLLCVAFLPALLWSPHSSSHGW